MLNPFGCVFFALLFHIATAANIAVNTAKLPTITIGTISNARSYLLFIFLYYKYTIPSQLQSHTYVPFYSYVSPHYPSSFSIVSLSKHPHYTLSYSTRSSSLRLYPNSSSIADALNIIWVTISSTYLALSP